MISSKTFAQNGLLVNQPFVWLIPGKPGEVMREAV